MAESEYSRKLRDPRWQKMRLQVLERDGWKCRACAATDRTLHVHHRVYTRGAEPWDYDLSALVTLCEACHEEEGTGQREADERAIYALRVCMRLNTYGMRELASDLSRLAEIPNAKFAADFLEGIYHLVSLTRMPDGALRAGVMRLDALVTEIEKDLNAEDAEEAIHGR